MKRLSRFTDSVSLAQYSSRILSGYQGDSGFSLLEMVVVLAIIGILVGIQLPNVIGNTDKAKIIAAQSRVSNAITECATAKANGATEKDLVPQSNPNYYDLIPSMESNPTGYEWSGQCSAMVLTPVDSQGEIARKQGFPIFYAKIASGGRIIKVADYCRPYGSLDFTKDCIAWDPTIDRDTWRTGRNLKDANWARKVPVEQEIAQ